MSNNTSSQGTHHLRAILSAALESDSGIRVEGITHAKAIHLRATLHSLRNVERSKSKKNFPNPEDPNHNRSAFDSLVTEIIPGEGDTVCLRIMRSEVAVQGMRVVDEKTGEAIDLEKHL